MSQRPAQSTKAPCPAPGLARLLWIMGFCAVLATGALLAAHSLGELDIWLHHRVGRDLLSGSGFPTTNTYSFTAPDYPWTNHEWLFQILAAVTGPDPASLAQDPAVAGWTRLRVGLTLTLLGVLLLGDGQWQRLRRPQTPNIRNPWLFTCLLAGLLLLWPRLTLRPELISYILFVGLVRLAEKAVHAPHTPGELTWRNLLHPGRPVGGAVLLTLVWAQCHGFSALAPVIWLLAGLTNWLDHGIRRQSSHNIAWKPWASGFGLLVLAQLATPNGLAGLTYPIRALGQFTGDGADLRLTISELAPLLTSRDSLDLTILAFKISLAWSVVWIFLQKGSMGLLRVLLWLIAAVATFQAQRNIGFYALTFMLLHTAPSPASISWSGKRPNFRFPPLLLLTAGTAVTLGLALWFGANLLNNAFYLHEGVSRRTGFGLTPARFPIAAAKRVAQAKPDHLVTNVDGAAFLLATARNPLFIDGRTEAYPADMWIRYARLKAGGDGALDLLRETGPCQVYITLANAALRPLVQTLLDAPDWSLAQADEVGLQFLPRPAGSPSTDNRTRLAELVRRLPAPPPGTGGTPLADLYLARATLAGLASLTSKREHWLERGLAAQPGHPTLSHNLGNLLLARGEFGPALARFRTALGGNPRLAGSALNAGVCLLNQNDPAQAGRYFERTVSLQPRNFQGWVNLGVARQRQGKTQAAIKAFETALTLNPRHTAVRGALSDLRGKISP